MLKNRAFQVKMVKEKPENNGSPTTEPVSFNIDPKQISDSATSFVIGTTLIVGAVYSGTKILNTICEIATIIAKSKFK